MLRNQCRHQLLVPVQVPSAALSGRALTPWVASRSGHRGSDSQQGFRQRRTDCRSPHAPAGEGSEYSHRIASRSSRCRLNIDRAAIVNTGGREQLLAAQPEEHAGARQRRPRSQARAMRAGTRIGDIARALQEIWLSLANQGDIDTQAIRRRPFDRHAWHGTRSWLPVILFSRQTGRSLTSTRTGILKRWSLRRFPSVHSARIRRSRCRRSLCTRPQNA
jgi:hypothetical protein